MRRTATRVSLAALVAVGVGAVSWPWPQSVLAHHAASGLYVRDGSVTVSGRVESVFWRNPHVRFTLMVPGDDGDSVEWVIEAGSVNSLERMGISQDVLMPGNLVEVTGLPGRNDEPIAFARSIVSADGEQIPVFFDINDLESHYDLQRERADVAGGPATDIFRVWVPTRVPNTGSGRYDFPLTDAARAIRDAWDPANDPSLNCEPPGMPAAMDNPYPIEFEDHGDEIVLRLEEWDGMRTIHMGSAADPSTVAPTPMGYSVGHWEGDTLVVETSRISFRSFDDLGTPQSEAIRVIERFNLDTTAGMLHWTGEIVDPATFTEPVVLEIEWEWIPGNVRKPYNCALPGGE